MTAIVRVVDLDHGLFGVALMVGAQVLSLALFFLSGLIESTEALRQ